MTQKSHDPPPPLTEEAGVDANIGEKRVKWVCRCDKGDNQERSAPGLAPTQQHSSEWQTSVSPNVMKFGAAN